VDNITDEQIESLIGRMRMACLNVRTKSMPLQDFIPLMQQAADTLESLRALQPSASAEQAIKQDTPAHVCKFEPAIDLKTREGWTECRCGKKQLYGKPYERPAKQGGQP
jgi:hypothetical protein